MKNPPEETLDPADWDEFRRFAHRTLDDALDDMRMARERRAWKPVPAAVRARLTAGLPRSGEGMEAAYRDYQELVAPYPTGNTHPRFWGWVHGNGTPMG